jgi:hypothetical protein
MKFVTRKTWGARPAKVPQPVHLAGTRGVKVHYTGDHVDPAVALKHGLHGMCLKQVRAIQNYHMDSNGWNDIGYTALVCHHGHVFEGRGLHRLPAANGAGLNSAHYAVCGLVGNSGLVVPSDAMLNGIRDAIEWLRSQGDAGNEIKGHRDGYDTDCPGPKLYAWVKAGVPRPGRPGLPPWPGRLLKLKKPMMHGQDVEQVQRWLNTLAAFIPVDGYYGPDTVRAVKGFQKLRKLDVDGIVGRKTWESLAR